MRVSRRFVAGAGGLLGLVGLVATACDASHPASAPSSARPSPRSKAPATPDAAKAADDRLRRRAITDERRLLAAAAAPAGVEPFATIRGLHRDHLKVLTGQSPAEPAAGKAPAAATLAAAERAVAVARRSDCPSATAALAPLLASLAASGNVAADLLAPMPS